MSSFQAPGDYSLSESVGKRVMTPGGAVAPGVAPELMPVLVLENDRPENLLLSGQRMFGRSSTVAAGAGRSSVYLLNPRADMLITISLVSAAVAFQVGVTRLGPGVTPTGTQSSGLPRDTRITPSGAAIVPSSSAILIADNTLGVAITSSIIVPPANTIYSEPIVLGPFDALYVCAIADASALTSYAISWRERRLNQSERL